MKLSLAGFKFVPLPLLKKFSRKLLATSHKHGLQLAANSLLLSAFNYDLSKQRNTFFWQKGFI
jgi:hypothetical protein